MSKDKTSLTITIGTHVEVTNLKRRGIVCEGPNNKGEYAVQMGSMSIWISSKQLKVLFQQTKASTKKQALKKSKRIRNKHKSSSEKTSMQIDLHGLDKLAALEQLELTLDRALLEDRDSIEIIHGLGTGTLRTAVENYLRNSSHIANFQLLPNNAGTTIAYLK